MLLVAAGAMCELARRLGSAATISGDAAWAAYWVASGVVWVLLSRWSSATR